MYANLKLYTNWSNSKAMYVSFYFATVFDISDFEISAL